MNSVLYCNRILYDLIKTYCNGIFCMYRIERKFCMSACIVMEFCMTYCNGILYDLLYWNILYVSD